LDTGKCQASPLHNSSTTTNATTTTAAAAAAVSMAAVDRCSSRDRSASAKGTSSPARCPSLGKSNPVSGKSSPAASPLSDSGRRRRAADRRNSPHQNSPHHAASCVAAVNSRAQPSASQHLVRSVGIQSERVTDSRLKPATSEEHAAIHPAVHSAIRPAVHSVRQSVIHQAVGAGHEDSQSERQTDRCTAGMQCRLDGNIGSGRQGLTLPDNRANANTNSSAAAAAVDEAGDGDEDDVKSRGEHYHKQSQTLADTSLPSQVRV